MISSPPNAAHVDPTLWPFCNFTKQCKSISLYWDHIECSALSSGHKKARERRVRLVFDSAIKKYGQKKKKKKYGQKAMGEHHWADQKKMHTWIYAHLKVRCKWLRVDQKGGHGWGLEVGWFEGLKKEVRTQESGKPGPSALYLSAELELGGEVLSREERLWSDGHWGVLLPCLVEGHSLWSPINEQPNWKRDSLMFPCTQRSTDDPRDKGVKPIQNPLIWAAERDLGDTDIPSRKDIHTVNIRVAAALCTWGSVSYKRVKSMTRGRLWTSLGTHGPSLNSIEAGMSGIDHCQVDPVQANTFSRLLWGWAACWCLSAGQGPFPSSNLALSEIPNNCISQSFIQTFLEKFIFSNLYDHISNLYYHISNQTQKSDYSCWGKVILTGWPSEQGVHDYGDIRDSYWVPGPSLCQQVPQVIIISASSKCFWEKTRMCDFLCHWNMMEVPEVVPPRADIFKRQCGWFVLCPSSWHETSRVPDGGLSVNPGLLMSMVRDTFPSDDFRWTCSPREKLFQVCRNLELFVTTAQRVPSWLLHHLA